MTSWTKGIVLTTSVGLFSAVFYWLLTTHGPLAPLSVQLGTVSRADLTPSVFGIGTVDARLSYAIGPTAPGRVLRVLADQGDTVKAGQLLAEMEPVDLDLRVQAAQSTTVRSRQLVQVADAQVAEAMSRAKLALMSRDRDRELYEQHAISKQVLDNSTAEAERAEAALLAARANAEVMRLDIWRIDAEARGLSSLRQSLKLVSPVDGVVISREAEPGTTVVAGQAIFRVIVPESLWVRARIDQSRAQSVQTGQTASIVLRSMPDTAIPGHVTRIELKSDPVTEERLVNVSFDAPPPQLYLGELAEVTIQLEVAPRVLVVPSAAIGHEDGQTGVWQKVAERARFKPVTLGSQAQPGVTQILTGLTEGEPVIVYSSAQLEPGVRVRETKVIRR